MGFFSWDQELRGKESLNKESGTETEEEGEEVEPTELPAQ